MSREDWRTRQEIRLMIVPDELRALERERFAVMGDVAEIVRKGELSISRIAELTGISRSALHRMKGGARRA